MKGDPLPQQKKLPEKTAAQDPEFVQFQNQMVGKVFL